MGEYQWSGSDNSDLGYLGNWFPLEGGPIVEPGPNDVAIIEFGPALTGTLDVGALDLIQQGPGEPALTITGASTQVTAASAGIGNTVTLDAGALLQVGTLSTAAGCTFLATGAGTSVDVTSTLSLAGTITLDAGASLYAAALSVAGTSTVTASGTATSFFATVSTSNTMTIGSTAGISSLILTDGASANIMSYDTEGDLNIGGIDGSYATLTVNGQASLISSPDNLVIGAGDNSNGLLSVTGAGSSAIFECWGTVFVGVAPGATGTISVSDGAYLELNSDFGAVDIASNVQALVEVTNAGSEIDAGPSVTIGGETVYEQAGTGQVLVQNGGVFRAFDHTEVDSGGTITVKGAGSLLETSQLQILSQGSIHASSHGTVQAAICSLIGGKIVLNGGTLSDAVNFTAQSGTLTGAGTLTAPRIINGGVFYAKGGTLDVVGAVTGTGAMHIETGSTLQLADSVASTQAITFESGANTLALADPLGFAASIHGFGASDTIDLLQTEATRLTYSHSTLTVFDGSTTVATLDFAGSYTRSSFLLASDGHGGTDIGYAASTVTEAPVPQSAWPHLAWLDHYPA